MSQLSLNLIAISVFAMTLSTLLGPLVQLSPVIPAIATASILGMAAIDTFSWQGQGSTLMLDWFAGFSTAHRARVVRHEAGHFLVAQRLGIPVTGYALTAWEALRQGYAGQGGVRFDTQELEAELQRGTLSGQLLDRYCAIWMAGSAAEQLIYGDVQGGADDRQKLQTVLAQLRLSPQERQQKERLAALRAKTLLQENTEAYGALLVALEQKAPIATCCEVIQQHPATAQS